MREKKRGRGRMKEEKGERMWKNKVRGESDQYPVNKHSSVLLIDFLLIETARSCLIFPALSHPSLFLPIPLLLLLLFLSLPPILSSLLPHPSL